jgi:hypothetical protein
MTPVNNQLMPAQRIDGIPLEQRSLNINDKDIHGKTALDYAKRSTNSDIQELLN